MDNVYDIKEKKNLNFILPMKHRLKETAVRDIGKTAVIIHLHYLETINFYLQYLEAIPDDIDLYITFSDERVRAALSQSTISARNSLTIIKKQNRGRDISSLLVACREQIRNYEYICFLHDKKEKKDVEKEDTRKWVSCLWENMIGSAEFMDNVRLTFQENLELGVLAPPFFMSEHITSMYDNGIWYNDFFLTQKLAEKLNLVCDLNEKKTPITLGTVFWARVSALKKLLEAEWKYEDFEEEPLGNDGTISHAVERILAYAAQDAGFDTGWVMTDRYMGESFHYMQSVLKDAFYRLKSSLGIWQIAELKDYENRVSELSDFARQYKKIYIFGAGVWAKRSLMMISDELRPPNAFLVSGGQTNPSNILGIPVLNLNQVRLDGNCGIIIATDEKYQQEILDAINGYAPGFSNYIHVKARSGV